jgi:DNA-binding transcriptional LysR family regulator
MTDVQIKCFLSLAKKLNFVEAAKDLEISQPTLSKQIAALEKNLNMQLFVRTNRKVILTPEGKIMLETFSSISR